MKLKSNEQNKTDVSFNFAHSFVIVKVVLSTKKNKDGKKNAPEQKRFLFKWAAAAAVGNTINSETLFCSFSTKKIKMKKED